MAAEVPRGSLWLSARTSRRAGHLVETLGKMRGQPSLEGSISNTVQVIYSLLVPVGKIAACLAAAHA